VALLLLEGEEGADKEYDEMAAGRIILEAECHCGTKPVHIMAAVDKRRRGYRMELVMVIYMSKVLNR